MRLTVGEFDLPRIDFERLDADGIRKIIRLLVVIQETTIAKLIEAIEKRGGPHVPTNSVSKRKKFPLGFAERLQEIVEALPPRDRRFVCDSALPALDSDLEEAYGDIGPRLAYSLDQWLVFRDVEANRFAEDCANKNGNYIIFRSPDGKSILPAQMKIVWRRNSNMMFPGFVTRRGSNGGVPKVTRGSAFMLGETVYTIGRIKRDSAIRFSRLRQIPRGQRTDLYGIRTGTSANTERPYAHLVYAYQIVRPRGDQLQKILSVKDMDDPLLDAAIDNMTQIRRLLTADGLMENGLQTNPLEQG